MDNNELTHGVQVPFYHRNGHFLRYFFTYTTGNYTATHITLKMNIYNKKQQLIARRSLASRIQLLGYLQEDHLKTYYSRKIQLDFPITDHYDVELVSMGFDCDF